MRMQNSLRIAQGAAVCFLALAAGTSAAFALSNDAQAIVDRVKATTPELHPVCSDRGKLTQVVTAATIALAEAKKINGDHTVARAAGQEAGRYLYFHCPS